MGFVWQSQRNDHLQPPVCAYYIVARYTKTGAGKARSDSMEPTVATRSMVPRHSNFDLALEKSTDLVGERTKLIFRAEAFNIFNHAEFRPPAATSATDGTFGQIGGTYAPRILQLALKVTF